MQTLEIYSADIDRYERITPEQERTADRETLINANLRLVWHIAKQFENRGVDEAELVSAGNYGLCEAAGKFDASRGIKFSTYASWWIRQRIYRTIEQQGVVRIPNNVVRNARALAKNNYERDGLDMSDNAYNLAQRAFRAQVSLSEPIDPGKLDAARETVIEDRDTPDPLQYVTEVEKSEFVEYCLSRLTTREADIMRRYFGLGGYEAQTFQQIADEWGISKERIRQLVDVAKRKLQFLKREGEEWANA